MTTTPKDDFAGASPRPWRNSVESSIFSRTGECIDTMVSVHTEDPADIINVSNARLVVAAVNAYNPERDAKLREALRETLQQLREYKEMLPPEMYNKLEAKAFAALALLPEEN